jgi:hypothetical protein
VNLDEVFAHLDPEERYAAASILRHEIQRRRKAAEAAREEERQYRRELVANGPTVIRAEKRCPRCDEVKPGEEFGKNSARPDGLQSICKPCQ